MTAIQILSDAHCESHRDAGVGFLRDIPVEAPILVVAGDLGSALTLPLNLNILCERWEHVVYVTGNHEYGEIGIGLHDLMQLAQRKLHNLHWLNNSSVTLEGQHFVGGTLWYRDTPMNHVYAKAMWDFEYIPDFRSWVYKENQKCIEALEELVTPQSIVVTHHLPCARSIAPHFAGQPLNLFFLCDLEGFILDAKPRLWIHGHTHTSFDYQVADTRVICNPFGYAFQLNYQFNDRLVVDLSRSDQ